MKSVYQTRSAMLATGASLVALLGAGQASAQDKPKTLGLEEIVVTAQKRAQSVQDVPIAITAFDGNFTKRVHLDDVKDLVKFAEHEPSTDEVQRTFDACKDFIQSTASDLQRGLEKEVQELARPVRDLGKPPKKLDTPTAAPPRIIGP